MYGIALVRLEDLCKVPLCDMSIKIQSFESLAFNNTNTWLRCNAIDLDVAANSEILAWFLIPVIPYRMMAMTVI